MKPLIIQFSGGKTSGFMAEFCKTHFAGREIHVLFQNTGKEDEKTLKFVNECDKRFNLSVIWLEAVVHYDERKGSSHKIVNFETAARNGEPYEAVIKKYGLSNMAYPHCTRELKLNVGLSYIKSLGLKDYDIAIGIRADEAHRINRITAAKNKIIYPLADIIQVNKKFVNNWWAKQDFNLDLPPYLGNCDCCYKKSINHLVSIAREQPQKLDWWQEMEKYADVGASVEPRKIFRGHQTAQDLRELAKQPTLFSNPEFEIEFDCFCKSS